DPSEPGNSRCVVATLMNRGAVLPNSCAIARTSVMLLASSGIVVRAWVRVDSATPAGNNIGDQPLRRAARRRARALLPPTMIGGPPGVSGAGSAATSF